MLGYGPLEAGLRLLPWTATFMTVAPVAGALADRIGERPFMVSGLVLQAIGMAWIALIAEPDMAYGQLVVPLIVAGRRRVAGDPVGPELGRRVGRAERRSARPRAPTA